MYIMYSKQIDFTNGIDHRFDFTANKYPFISRQDLSISGLVVTCLTFMLVPFGASFKLTWEIFHFLRPLSYPLNAWE